MPKKILNIGIVAHVDAGKTTLTEQLLYHSGAIRKLGSVDDGSTITDSTPLERKRGITIFNATASFEWNEYKINLIDTPGHIDFVSEVNRALSVLDGVLLIVSAVEGVQAHTLHLAQELLELNIPYYIFINKIDRDGADIESLVPIMEQDLNIKTFCLNIPDKTNQIINFRECSASPLLEQSYEHLAELDDEVLTYFLEGSIENTPQLQKRIYQQIKKQSLIPICFGIAKQGIGIENVLNLLCNFTSRNNIESEGLNAGIFKIEHHHRYGKLAHIRLYSGLLHNKDSLYCSRIDKEVKVNQLLKNNNGKIEVINELEPNDIGIISISESLISGDQLGLDIEPIITSISQAVLSVQIKAKDSGQYQELSHALIILDSEDPNLALEWNKEDKTFTIKTMGRIQSEVISNQLEERFLIKSTMSSPSIDYKETPRSTAEGYVRYWMPKPCWAIMTFEISPGELGSGIVYESRVSTDDISQKYQNEIKRAIPWSLQQGIKGWPVTDIIIKLLKGEEHQIHSNPGDFLLATPMGIMRGIEQADTVLLEPIYHFEIKANQELLGTIANNLNQMKAIIGTPMFEGDQFKLEGTVPVANAIDYPIQFSSTTSGKGRLKLRIAGYQPTTTTDDKIKKYKGVSPLDESKWILHNRGAFKADERKR